ncbi:hypothetical protein BDW59DRAFT_142165 [Aspergillus cavernicola]|uniref:Amino acid permease/ SLC12A domain-containing protein n=1 Tax=Aspergillus cavernicola TaxID=176166 RepID=A0ABR4IPF1_9EURO
MCNLLMTTCANIPARGEFPGVFVLCATTLVVICISNCTSLFVFAVPMEERMREEFGPGHDSRF